MTFTRSPHLPSCQSVEMLHVDFTYSLLFLPSGDSVLASLFLLLKKKKKARQSSSVLFTCSEILKGSSSPAHGKWLRIGGGQETWCLRPPLIPGGYLCTQNIKKSGQPQQLIFSLLHAAARPGFLGHQFCHVPPLLGKLQDEVQTFPVSCKAVHSSSL